MDRPSRWLVNASGVPVRDRYCNRRSNVCDEDYYYRRLVAYYIGEARRQRARAERAEAAWCDRLAEAQAIMRKHGLKIDNLDDPMQKLAFTLYTMIAEQASEYRDALLGEEGADVR